MDLVKIDYNDPKVIATLKATVAQGLNDAEYRLFAEQCRTTGLSAVKKEIWAIKAGGRLQIMTGIQGYHQIANSHFQYDGIESGLVGKGGEYLPLTYPGEDYIGAWAKVYRKDRRLPHEGVTFLKEYDKGVGNWKSMKRVMINKCAESVALRKAFPQELNGLYTQEEMPHDYEEPKLTVDVTPGRDRTPQDDMTPHDRLPTLPKYEGDPWQHILDSPLAAKATGKMLCEFDEEWFEKVVNKSAYWSKLSEKDKPAVMAAYQILKDDPIPRKRTEEITLPDN